MKQYLRPLTDEETQASDTSIVPVVDQPIES